MRRLIAAVILPAIPITIVALAASGALGFGSATSAHAEESVASSLHTVRIDAVVANSRGLPIGGLKPADFELREDGIVQKIDSVKVVNAIPITSTPTPSPPTPRMFGIYFDEYHLTDGPSLVRAREAIGRFIDQELRPGDQLIVMKPLDSLFGLRLTSDFDHARRVVSQIVGRRGDYVARSDYERNYMAGDPDRIEAARIQVALSALNALAVTLGQADEGRKSLIVVTEGLTQPARRRGEEYLATLNVAIRSANRATVAVYPVDPRERPAGGLPAAGDETEIRETMQRLAQETSGAVIDGDLSVGLTRASEDANTYYLLTYKASHAEDGRFHRVDLQVKRTGAEVRARNGFWAPSADDALRAAIVKRASEPPPPVRYEPPRRISTLIEPWFGLSRGDDSRTRVTFVWEPARRVPGERLQRTPVRIQLKALAADDTVLFEGTVMAIGSTAADEHAAVGARAVFDAPPGRLRLRMAIEDDRLQQIDSDVREIGVRDWRAAVAIGTPEVFRARNARDIRMLDSNLDATPVASREFSRTESLLVRFQAYSPAAESTVVTARLLARGGQAMRELPVQMAAGSTPLRKVELPLNGLAPGEYTIELSVKTRGAAEVKEKLNFRVTS